MALTTCRECNKQISDQADACPHCGAPNLIRVQRLANIAQEKENKKMLEGIGCLVTGAVVCIGFYLYVHSWNQQNDEQEKLHPTCQSSWAACVDNTDMVNKYSGWTAAQVECKIESAAQAKYGTPSFPWVPFSSFLKGADYKATGIAVLIEPDAQFSNAFGAMVHSQVTCRYDLRAKKVLSISILPAK